MMPNRVAFISFGISNISGGGGAERFFADLFDYYTSKKGKFRLIWLIDHESKTNLKNANKLVSNKSLIRLWVFSNRFKTVLENLQVLIFIVLFRIKVVHIPIYNSFYFPILNFIQKLPGIIRPKISVNVIDCSLPFCYMDKSALRHSNVLATFGPLFNEIKVNGYIAWNRNFVDFFNSFNTPKLTPYLYSIKSRFCDTKKYSPSENKINRIVFASRLAVFKNADWFIEAIHYLKVNHPDIIRGWTFTICGDGPLKDGLVALARNKGLEDSVEFIVEPNMEKVLNSSKCFVSCQDYDNFPSMSMAEAMASGNVIVSRNVGQTDLFVVDDKNGFLAEEDTPEGIALALLKFLRNQERFSEMSDYSVYLMKEVHSPENFIPQIEEYWTGVLKKN